MVRHGIGMLTEYALTIDRLSNVNKDNLKDCLFEQPERRLHAKM